MAREIKQVSILIYVHTYVIFKFLFVVLLSSESEDGEVWYFSSPLQLEELMLALDPNEMEVALYRELSDYKEEIVRQMELTETLTNQFKGNKKSYLEIENSKINLINFLISSNQYQSLYILNNI